MCGIVGIASQTEPVSSDLLVTMRESMCHRGPDDAGIWTSADGLMGLAQRRLAIIDTSPAGHQPMQDASGKLCITYNGEIYNFRELRKALEAKGCRFRTDSDTEVILEAYRAWGVECLARFNGVFAFGLYDSEARKLFLARDRPGEKPLFYRHTPGRLAFASELKALMADPSLPRLLDPAALDYFLAYGYIPGEMCILQGVRKLPQGHAMTFDLASGALDVRQYWRLPEHAVDPRASGEELLDEVEGLLEDAVRLRMIADVPVGILLSGGIDSSLVTAMAARTSSNPLKTFTVSFPGYGTFDEGPFARTVADHFGTEHTDLVAEAATYELLPGLARQFDEPIADASLVPTHLVAQLVRQHAKVALGGDGGDELFGGYPHYNWILRLDRLQHMVPRSLRQLVSRGASRWLPPGVRGRNHLIGFGADLASSIAHVNLFFDAETRRRLLVPDEFRRDESYLEPEVFKAGFCDPRLSPLQQASRVDFQTTMVDAYLVKADRATMLSGVEIRAPFLDHRLIEFAFGRLPDTLRVTSSERKILARRLAQRLLPTSLDLKRKQGFALPLAAWFKGEWGRFMESVLDEAHPSLFRKDVIRNLIAGQRSGHANADRLFALTMFELWRREYCVAISG